MPTRGCALSKFGVLVVMLASLLLCVVFYSVFQLAPMPPRLEALPHYARSYVRGLRPKPPLPTPPPVSASDLETSLQTRLQPASEPQGPHIQVDAVESGQAGDADNYDQPMAGQEQNTTLLESQVTEVLPSEPAVTLSGFQHEWQTWNNCGPATISMNLSFFGHGLTQLEAAQFLKPNPDDKNVSPDELVAYARSQGYEGLVGQGGDLDMLKRLLSNRLPVIVETWIKPEDNGGMGHYYLLTGYDESQYQFLAYDSLHGPDVRLAIDELDDSWRVFNRTFVVILPTDNLSLLYGILGPRGDPTRMTQQALLSAQMEATNERQDAFAWFNVGTGYAHLGEYTLAASAFDQARRLGLPYRMLWYQFGIFDTYLALQRYQETIELTTATLTATGGSEEMYYYRGLARQAEGQVLAAEEDFRAALDYNARFDLAAQALAELNVND